MPKKYIKYTYEEVKAKFEERGYTLITKEYINTSQKLEYICKKHNDYGVLTTEFRRLLQGNGCKLCGNENRRIDITATIECCNNLGLIFVKSYLKNNNTWVDFICQKHKDKGIQSSSASNLRKATIGCKYCCGRERSAEEFEQMMNLKNPNILITGKYINSTTKIKCKCLIDGHEWEADPSNLLNGYGCPICGIKSRSISRMKTQEEFIKELYDKNPNVEVESTYNGIDNDITCKCKIDGYIWKTKANSLLNYRSGCPKCVEKKIHNERAKTNEQFLNELKISNPDVIPLEEYYNNSTKIKCRCLIHNYEWSVSPNKLLLRQTGCPKCTKYANEVKLHEILEKHNIKYIAQKRYSDCRDKNPLPYDFYLKDYNILIEYDGEGHYKSIRRGTMTDEEAEIEFEKVKHHDSIKTEYCKTHNIPLIRIPYWERKNMECFLLSELSKYIDINKIKTA